MNVADALAAARERLGAAGVADPVREAGSLLAFALSKTSTFLIAHPEYQLTHTETEIFASSLSRRVAREPFQYIVGHQEFYGLDFEVSPDVLIPRPETEILVEDAIAILRDAEEPTFCEIGVGSGCISVSILCNVQDARGVGVDISSAALAVAGRNAVTHRVDDRLELRGGDVFAAVSERFDLIASNPPYIPAGEVPGLQREVVDFEPHSALAGGHDGLDIIRLIIAGSPEHLRPHGVLLIEIGYGQSGDVAELIDPSIWEKPEFLPDLQGVPRVLKVRARN